MSWLDNFKKKEQQAFEEKTRAEREAEARAKLERDKVWTARRENHLLLVRYAIASNIETYLLEFANEIMAWHPKCGNDANITRGMIFWEQPNSLQSSLWEKSKKVKPEPLKNFSFQSSQVLKMLYWRIYIYSEIVSWTPTSDNDTGFSETRYGFIFSVTEDGLFFGDNRYKEAPNSINYNDKTQIQEKIIKLFENPTSNPTIYV